LHWYTTCPKTEGHAGMSFISYAQNYEDVRLWRAFNDVVAGRYLDIGTQDPVRDSVSLAFYERGWRGVHVEPTPTYASAMRAARPDETVIEAAVTTMPGPMRLYEIPTTGLSTGISDIAQRHVGVGWSCKEITVATVTLSGLFDHMGPELIHWLKIDVEGMEADVLASWGDHPARPAALVIEATAPTTQDPTHEQWLGLVLARGYVEVLFDGLSRYFIHESHADRGNALALSPNVFDGFQVTQSHFTAGMLAAEHEASVAAVRQQALADVSVEMATMAEKLEDAEAQHLADVAAALAKAQAAEDAAATLQGQLQEEMQAHAEALAEAQEQAATASSQLETAQQQVAELERLHAEESQSHAAVLTALERQRDEQAQAHAEALAEAQFAAAQAASRLETAMREQARLEQQNAEQARNHALALGAAHDRIAATEGALANANNRLAALQQEQLGLARENGRLEGQLAAQIEANAARLSDAAAVRRDLASRQARAERALATTQAEAAASRIELAMQARDHEAALAAAAARQADQAAALAAAHGEVDRLGESAAALSRQLADTEAQRHGLADQNRELLDQRDGLAADLEAARQQAAEQLQALHSDIAQLRDHIAWREQQLQQAAGLLGAIRDPLTGLPRLLSTLVRRLAGEAQAVALADLQAAAAHWQAGAMLPAVPEMSQGEILSLAGNVRVADEAFMHGGFGMGESDGPITSVSRLLAPNDRHFIHAAYQAVLGRAPDGAGEAYYLARLRAGVHKLAILKQLRQSAEGRAFIPGVAGLDRAIRRHRWATMQLVGGVVRLFTGAEGNGATHRHLRILANEIGCIRVEQSALAGAVRRISAHIENRRSEAAVHSTAEANDVSFVSAEPSPQVKTQLQQAGSGVRQGLAGFFQTRIWSQ
jgi:FkbM family methyltransferase